LPDRRARQRRGEVGRHRRDERSAVVIGFAEATRLYAELTWLRLWRRRVLVISATLLVLPLVGAAGLALAGHWGVGLYDEINRVTFHFVLPFAPALLMAPFLGEELDRNTFTFVFSRPAPRVSLMFGKVLAVGLPLLVAVALTLLLTWVIAMARFPTDFA